MRDALPERLVQLKDMGHVVFTDGELNLNVIGVRSPWRGANAFDDMLELVYREQDSWVTRRFQATTDPGSTYLRRRREDRGCAILCPGQYRGAYVIGRHRGRYPALVQDRAVNFVRDDTNDLVLDIAGRTVHSGVIGLNIHAADLNPFDAFDIERAEVGPWSAGCQVLCAARDYRAFWDIIVRSALRYGRRFTYTLIDSKE